MVSLSRNEEFLSVCLMLCLQAPGKVGYLVFRPIIYTLQMYRQAILQVSAAVSKGDICYICINLQVCLSYESRWHMFFTIAKPVQCKHNLQIKTTFLKVHTLEHSSGSSCLYNQPYPCQGGTLCPHQNHSISSKRLGIWSLCFVPFLSMYFSF